MVGIRLLLYFLMLQVDLLLGGGLLLQILVLYLHFVLENVMLLLETLSIQVFLHLVVVFGVFS